MPDAQEVFRLATSKVEPDPDALERQVRRQRAEGRRSRIRAYVAAAAVLIVAVVAAFALSRTIRNEPAPEGSRTLAPPVATNLTFLPALPPGATPQTAATVDLRGKQTSAISGVPLDAYAPSVTADGTQMAFVASPNEVTENQIGIMRTDGTGARFVPTPGIDVGWTVAISPDGTRVAFEGQADGNTDIWVVNSDGTGLLRLTDDPATDQYPTWSPNGTTIAYDNAGAREHLDDPQFSKTAEIFSVPADGGSPTQLTHNGWFDAAPSYARDGKTIVDESWGGLSLMQADGTQLQKLRVPTSTAFTPRFSPDGRTIAFSYVVDRNRPTTQLGREFGDWGLCLVALVDPRTGQVTKLRNIGMATDRNTPQWVDDGHLLIMRVPAKDPSP
jgi:Tol biopolymer transport system component